MVERDSGSRIRTNLGEKNEIPKLHKDFLNTIKMEIIQIFDLGKRYYITHGLGKFRNYTNFRETVTERVKTLFRRSSMSASLQKKEEIWALRNVTFDVKQGEKIGIIGKNGSGKTTLFKILSRITEPTEGSARIKGRISSLLEVGTGFHLELTGRENIYMNGAILGMKKVEIDKKFDEIVDFSGVEKFLDTPVKRYSSGMNVRLAYAVAAHLEPEILLVDEVLAVGDAEFQKKCLGKMDSVSKEEGRTIMFVSHNLAAIRQLCAKTVLIEKGNIKAIGETGEVINKYLSEVDAQHCYVDLTDYPRSGSGEFRFEYAQIEDSIGEPNSKFSLGDDFSIVFSIIPKKGIERPVRITISIRTSEGTPVTNMINTDSKYETGVVNGKTTFAVSLKDIRFYPDTYYISLKIQDRSTVRQYDNVADCLSFDIVDGGVMTSRRLLRGQ